RPCGRRAGDDDQRRTTLLRPRRVFSGVCAGQRRAPGAQDRAPRNDDLVCIVVSSRGAYLARHTRAVPGTRGPRARVPRLLVPGTLARRVEPAPGGVDPRTPPPEVPA